MNLPLKHFFLLIAICTLLMIGCTPEATPTQEAEATQVDSLASGEVKVLLIGKPDEDGIDPLTGAPIPGVGQLETMFETAYPNIDLQITNIPWGSGATG